MGCVTVHVIIAVEWALPAEQYRGRDHELTATARDNSPLAPPSIPRGSKSPRTARLQSLPRRPPRARSCLNGGRTWTISDDAISYKVQVPSPQARFWRALD